jgi:hypothetical protein
MRLQTAGGAPLCCVRFNAFHRYSRSIRHAPDNGCFRDEAIESPHEKAALPGDKMGKPGCV